MFASALVIVKNVLGLVIVKRAMDPASAFTVAEQAIVLDARVNNIVHTVKEKAVVSYRNVIIAKAPGDVSVIKVGIITAMEVEDAHIVMEAQNAKPAWVMVIAVNVMELEI